MWSNRAMGDGTDTISTRDQRLRALLAIPLALLVATLSIVLVRTADSGPADADPILPGLFSTTTTRPPTTTTTAPKPRPHVPVSTPLASPKGEINVYNGPNGMVVGKVGYWYGRAITTPIVESWEGWVRVMLPERPNGKTGWVRKQDVVLSSTPYRIVIRLSETKLILYKDGFPVFVAPVGVGKDSTPTPRGRFFVGVIEKPGPHGYGPIVLDTTGHSDAIRSWQGSGDAITAIHGPISRQSDAQIGTTGAHISNGCIRMHEADQVKLDGVPLGTIVDINA
jgi:lipoprotein-anchoring transpeptidase ErfK/SrfK